MSETTLQPGDIIQLDPEVHTHQGASGRLSSAWWMRSDRGVCCHVRAPDGEAHYRAKSGTFQRVGRCAWYRAEGDAGGKQS